MHDRSRYSFLFSPLQVRNRQLRNRIVMAPMAVNYTAEGGFVSDREYREYRDKESEPWLAQAMSESGGAK